MSAAETTRRRPRLLEGLPLRGVLLPVLPRPTGRRVLLGSLGGAIAIAVVACIGELTRQPVLAAAFGSSCVLLFAVPEAPFSQPINVVGGHLVSAIVGLLAVTLLPVEWWSVALAVGVAIAAMVALRVTHPPAGGNPIAIAMAGSTWGYLLVPILVGALLLVVVALLFHRLSGTRYPAA